MRLGPSWLRPGPTGPAPLLPALSSPAPIGWLFQHPLGSARVGLDCLGQIRPGSGSCCRHGSTQPSSGRHPYRMARGFSPRCSSQVPSQVLVAGPVAGSWCAICLQLLCMLPRGTFPSRARLDRAAESPRRFLVADRASGPSLRIAMLLLANGLPGVGSTKAPPPPIARSGAALWTANRHQ